MSEFDEPKIDLNSAFSGAQPVIDLQEIIRSAKPLTEASIVMPPELTGFFNQWKTLRASKRVIGPRKPITK